MAEKKAFDEEYIKCARNQRVENQTQAENRKQLLISIEAYNRNLAAQKENLKIKELSKKIEIELSRGGSVLDFGIYKQRKREEDLKEVSRAISQTDVNRNEMFKNETKCQHRQSLAACEQCGKKVPRNRLNRSVSPIS